MRGQKLRTYLVCSIVFVSLIAAIRALELSSWTTSIAAVFSVLSVYRWRAYMNPALIAVLISVVTVALPLFFLILIGRHAGIGNPIKEIMAALAWPEMLAPVLAGTLTALAIRQEVGDARHLN